MRKIVTLLLIFNALNAFSDTMSLTLENAVQKAYENDKGIKSSKLELENAKLDKWMAFKSGLPTVTYNAQTTVDGDLSKAYLSLNQTIFDGGKTIIAIKSSNKYLDLSEYKLENTKNSVELTVINQYITILSNQKQLEIYKNSKKELENSYQKIQRKYELGLVNKTDVLDMNYSLINLESSIIQVENALEISKLNLKNTLGLNKSDDIQLEEIENLDVEVLSIDFSKDIEQAKETSLTAKTSRVTTELQKASEGTSRATLLPEVSLNVLYGNLEYVDGNLKEAVKDEHIDSATSITISGTLFDWGSNWDSYKQAKNKTKIAVETENTTQDTLEVNIKTAYLELLRLEKQKEAKEKAFESAKENYTYQKQRYEAGLISTTDYLDAENTYRESEIGILTTKLSSYYAYRNYLSLLK